ncbi:hypothetical protein ACFX1Q_021071 [Malus domestica]
MGRVSSGGEDEEAAGCRKCSSGPGLLLRMDLRRQWLWLDSEGDTAGCFFTAGREGIAPCCSSLMAEAEAVRAGLIGF